MDGKTDTYWHSDWENKDAANVWIEIDMKRVQTVGRLRYIPRQSGGPNGKFLKYKIEVRKQTSDPWETVIASEIWADNSNYSDEKTAVFPPVEAQFVRLTGLETGVAPGGDADAHKKFGSAAEIYLGYPESQP